MSKKTSYMERAAAFLESGQIDLAHGAIAEGLDYAAQKMMSVFNGVNMKDLPLFLATVRVLNREITAILPKEGKDITDFIYSKISCISVNAGELFRQMQQEKDDGEENPHE